MQSYLQSEKLTTRQKKYLFRFRTRMIKVSYNYGNKTVCPLCSSNEDDTQEHLFNCLAIKLISSEVFHIIDEKYEDIFSSNIEKLIKVSKICESAARTRERLSA